MNGWIYEWVNLWMGEFMNGWIYVWMTKWVNEWVNGLMCKLKKRWMNKCVNERIGEWITVMREWKNRWMNKCMNERIGEWIDMWMNDEPEFFRRRFRRTRCRTCRRSASTRRPESTTTRSTWTCKSGKWRGSTCCCRTSPRWWSSGGETWSCVGHPSPQLLKRSKGISFFFRAPKSRLLNGSYYTI